MQKTGPPPPDRLAASGLTVSYDGVTAVVEVSLSLPAGCLCGLVGMNGAGKSTLLRALAGFLVPTTGRVLIDGLPPPLAQRRQRLAYMPQSEQVDWDFPIRVRDVVMQGRYGRMHLLRWPSAARWFSTHASNRLSRPCVMPMPNSALPRLREIGATKSPIGFLSTSWPLAAPLSFGSGRFCF